MPYAVVKARSDRGKWTARVTATNGSAEELPVILGGGGAADPRGLVTLKGVNGALVYQDANPAPKSKAEFAKWAKLLAEKRKVVMATTWDYRGETYKRNGYVAVYEVEPEATTEGLIKLKLVKRLANVA